MKSIKFPGHNLVMGAGQPEYEPLPACRAVDGTVTFCFELDDAEVAKLMITRKVWVQLLTFGEKMQPLLIAVERPPLGAHIGVVETTPYGIEHLCGECAAKLSGAPTKTILLDDLCQPDLQKLTSGHRHGVCGLVNGSNEILVRKDHHGK